MTSPAGGGVVTPAACAGALLQIDLLSRERAGSARPMVMTAVPAARVGRAAVVMAR